MRIELLGVLVVISVACLLSGCGEKPVPPDVSGPPAPTPPDPVPPPPIPIPPCSDGLPCASPSALHLEFLECYTIAGSIQAKAEAMQQQMPNGYAPDPIGPIAVAGTIAQSCKYLIINNQTSVREFAMFWVSAATSAPEEARGPNGNSYMFESVVSDPFVRDLLTANGFPAVTGIVNITQGATGPTVQVSIDGEVYYSLVTAGDMEVADDRAISETRLHASNAGNVSWAEYYSDYNQSSLLAMGTAQTTGGTLSQIAVHAEGQFLQVPVVANLGRMTLSFKAAGSP